jgi:hypothetical protein
MKMYVQENIEASSRMAMTTFTTMLAFTIMETIVRSWLTIKGRPPSSFAGAAGISTGLKVAPARLATVTLAATSTSSSRRISWAKTQRTLPSDSRRTLTARLSSSFAAFWKSIAIEVTTKTIACSRPSALVIEAQVAKPFGASAFEELEIFTVVDHAASVGVLEVHAHRKE